MKKVLTLTLILLATIASQAQTAGSYGELRAKVLHVKERYAGQDTGSDQAAAVVLLYPVHAATDRLRSPETTVG